MPPSPADRALRAGPALVAAALALAGLSRWTLWQDEAFTWMLEERDLAGMIDGAGQDRHPPLFYLVVAAFRWLGDRDFALRLPSALAFVGAVLLVGLAGTRHANRFVGGMAAWIVALSPVALLFANTARMYALLLFWGSALLLAGLEVARGPRPGRWAVAYALATAGAIWTHYAGFAAVAAASFGTALAGLTWAPPPDAAGRGRRALLLAVALALAAASFLPWALGPLQFQLAEKDVPSDRTWSVLGYLLWTFDGRIPWLSVLLVALEAVGLVVALRRRGGLGWMLIGIASAGILAPWALSRSLPAQNPRNYLDFLPAAALLCGLALDALRVRIAGRWPAAADPGSVPARAVAVAVLAVLAADPLYDLCTRTVSPQEPGVGFDYAVESDVLDASAPANGGLYFRPAYLLIQYRRYAPGLAARMKLKVDRHAWLAISRGEWLDSAVAARYTDTCTFKYGFRVLVYAESGPGCEAVQRWMTEVAADREYVPFLQELARRAMDRGDLDAAEAYAERATLSVHAHPAPALTLADARLRAGNPGGALNAADTAVAISREWHMGGGAIAQAQGMRAQALGKLGRAEEAKAAMEIASCARRAVFPNACGAWWAPLAAPFVSPVPPPQTFPPLPALSESQAAPPPAGPPPTGERVALWAFDGEVLPEGWVDAAGSEAAPTVTMDTVEGSVALAARTSEDQRLALTCGALVPADRHMALRARWKADVGAGDAPLSLALEVRMADASGTVMKINDAPVMERPLYTGSGSGWRVDRWDFRTRPEVQQVRVCAKVEGARQGRLLVDWLELARLVDP